MVDITLADEIFTIIQRLGTDKVFLVPGGGNMFLVDAAGNQDGIEIVPTHHEQAAVIAAEYYSRISGKLGVAVVTTGPGSTNAITGIAGAWRGRGQGNGFWEHPGDADRPRGFRPCSGLPGNRPPRNSRLRRRA